MRFSLRRSLLPVVLLATAFGCGSSSPDINSVSVNPSTISLSGISETVTFAVSCNVAHSVAASPRSRPPSKARVSAWT